MTRWTTELDDWHAWLERLESALDAEAWDDLADEPRWRAPEDLTEPPDEGERARLMALTLRAARLRDRLDEATRRSAEDAADQRRVRGAHGAYRAQGRRRGPAA